MELQQWDVWKNEDGILVKLGSVNKGITETKKIANDKAYFMFNNNKNYTIGWKMQIQKGGMISR